MHEDRAFSCVIWKDKCLEFLLSTNATPIWAPCEVRDMVPRRHGATLEHIFAS